MAKKYNFSRTLGDETFTVEGCDSFDEARKVVDKAVYERQLEISEKNKHSVIKEETISEDNE